MNRFIKNVKEYRVEITTGQYHAASLESQELVRGILGEQAETDFEIYFHWYNVMHEFGHVIMEFNTVTRPHPVEEEQLVNDFAVAYWRRYGEPEKLERLRTIVTTSLGRFTVPADENMSHIEYATAKWDHMDELFNFNNYGWFQFSCVQQSLSRPESLEQALVNMGVQKAQPQEKTVLRYQVDDSMASRVIKDAAKIMRAWGILLPERIEVLYSDDPNCHMCESVLL